MPTSTFPLTLTHAQRKVIATVLPALADRLNLGEAASRTVSFTLKELREIAAKCKAGMPKATNGMVRNSLRHIMGRAYQAIEQYQESGIGELPPPNGSTNSRSR